jgi:cellulose synthase/poly-beta-1,6-N-acetylglucosamine synthase-like glycosyltransferase
MVPNRFIIGVCAYNEENNIGHLLQNLLSEQNLPKESRILVVCSGCTDKTSQIVAGFQKKDSRIEPIIENVRRGKASALNRIFRSVRADSDILVLVNADALPEKGSINRIVAELADPDVGAVFAQPVPIKSPSSSCYGVTRLIWRLHHIISMLDTPKLSGELCAIRTECLKEIPENTSTDEPYIEDGIQRQHKKTVYAPKTLVYIRCPTNIADIVKQRKRIWIGHLQLRNATGYKVSTSSFKNMLLAVFRLSSFETLYVLPGGFLELLAYLEAKILFSKGAIPYIWEPIKSTKASV